LTRFYVPVLMSRFVRAAVMVLFAAWTLISIFLVTKLRIGLEQELAMPDGSYVLDYLVDLKVIECSKLDAFFIINL
jgi:hypothetical protein